MRRREPEFYNNPGFREKGSDTGYYIQYSEEQNKFSMDKSYEKELVFWEKALQDQSGYLNIPRSEDNYEYYKGSSYTFDVPEKLTRSLYKYSKENNFIINIPLLTSYVVLLHKYSGQILRQRP